MPRPKFFTETGGRPKCSVCKCLIFVEDRLREWGDWFHRECAPSSRVQEVVDELGFEKNSAEWHLARIVVGLLMFDRDYRMVADVISPQYGRREVRAMLTRFYEAGIIYRGQWVMQGDSLETHILLWVLFLQKKVRWVANSTDPVVSPVEDKSHDVETGLPSPESPGVSVH